MDRFFRGWELTKASARIVFAEKRLLLLTLISTVCTVGTAAVVLLPFVLDAQRSWVAPAHLPLAQLLLLHVLTTTISLFFNTALAAIVLARLYDDRLGLGDALGIALDHIGSILVIAVLSATIGAVLRAIGRRFGLGVAIASLLFGAAWEVATMLVVPVMIVEGGDPFSAIARSVELMRKTWGERLATGIGLGGVGFVLALPAMLVGAHGLMSPDPDTRTASICFAVAYIAVLSLVMSTLMQVVRAALFYYAETGNVPAGFDRDTMKLALDRDS